MTIVKNTLMKRPRTAILATALLAGSLGTALAQPAPQTGAPTPTPIAELRTEGPATVRGEIVEIFGNRAILKDATGRTLVDFGPRMRGGDIAVGRTVTVEGRFGDGQIERATLAGEGGARSAEAQPGGPRGEENRDGPRKDDRRAGEERRAGPKGEKGPHGDERRAAGENRPAERELIAAVEREGYREARVEDYKGRHAEVVARDADGQSWELHVAYDGSIKKREEAVTPPANAVLTKAAEDAGFSDARIGDIKKRHAEVMARDSEGRQWELHVGFDGEIRKRELVMAPMAPEAIRAALEKAGYTFEGSFETKKKHIEAIATNDRGERVEVHLDAEGHIRKEERIF